MQHVKELESSSECKSQKNCIKKDGRIKYYIDVLYTLIDMQQVLWT